MEQENTVKTLWSIFGTLVFWGYVAAKLATTVFVAWSWWWVLLPIVPWLALLIAHAGL